MNVGEKLRYARDRAGLTGAQVEERAEIGKSSLSEFENGRREPRISQLEVLARLYERSISFFLSEDPVEEEVVLWRERPVGSPEQVKATEVQFLRLCEQYHNLEVWCHARVECRLPEDEGSPETYSYGNAENLAKRVLDVLNLGDRPGEGLLRTLEEVCGVKVFHMAFEPSGTAASTRSDAFGAAILLNSRNVRWRRNFDLAHELFHLLTWKIFRGASSASPEPTRDEERFAGCFARNLLMPVEAVRRAVNERMQNGRIGYEDVFDTARQFDVSVRALLWQMKWAYNLDAEKIERAIEKTEQFTGGSDQRERRNTEPGKLPERYHALAVKALRRGEISIGRFAEYLGVSRHQAMGYLRQEIDDAEEIEITVA